MTCPKCNIEMVGGKIRGTNGIPSLWFPSDIGKFGPIFGVFSEKSVAIKDIAYRCPNCTMIIIENSKP